jgi:uncharacterized protein YndB with AHSA1/START domain
MNLSKTQRSVTHNTFVIERSYGAPAERVFAALSDPAKKRRWFVDGGGSEVQAFEMDFRTGGRELARSLVKAGPVAGSVLTAEGRYLDIVPDRRVVVGSTMSLGDRRISASLVTFELVRTEAGTDLVLTHQGAFFEGSDGPEMREAGWRALLDRLVVEVSGS